jgi:hypothetical protein
MEFVFLDFELQERFNFEIFLLHFCAFLCISAFACRHFETKQTGLSVLFLH